MGKYKVGINGFGRIARIILRSLELRDTDIEIVGINLHNANFERMAYQVEYDSVFGRFDGKVEATETGIRINGKDIKVFSEDDPADIKWWSCGAEYVIEATGKFLTRMACCRHFIGGVKRVIITAPGKSDDIPTFVMGVNEDSYDPATMTVVSNGGRDWRTGRSVFNNIIPSTTGAAKAVGLVIPDLKGKMTGMSFRVPCNDVSVVDLTAELEKETTYEEICKAIKKAADGPMKGIIEYNDDELVSGDLRGNYNTCIFDEKAGIMLDSSFVKLIAWYDNKL